MTMRGFIVLIAAVAGIAATARLGLWQLDRGAQKRALQAQIDERRRLPPLPADALAQRADEVPAQLQREIELRGEWLEQHTVYLDNRPMNGRPGFVVLTPLHLPDGSAVAVERGWIPRDFQDRARIVAPPPEPGTVPVRGRIVERPARLFEFDQAASGTIRQNVELFDYAREVGLPLRPLSILQTGPSPSPLKRDWPLPAAGVEKHDGYAFQWFALSALILVLYVWYQFIRPRRRGRR